MAAPDMSCVCPSVPAPALSLSVCHSVTCPVRTAGMAFRHRQKLARPKHKARRLGCRRPSRNPDQVTPSCGGLWTRALIGSEARTHVTSVMAPSRLAAIRAARFTSHIHIHLAVRILSSAARDGIGMTYGHSPITEHQESFWGYQAFYSGQDLT